MRIIGLIAWEGSISVLRLISSEVLWFCENDHVETREPRKTILYEKELFRAFASLLH